MVTDSEREQIERAAYERVAEWQARWPTGEAFRDAYRAKFLPPLTVTLRRWESTQRPEISCWLIDTPDENINWALWRDTGETITGTVVRK